MVEYDDMPDDVPDEGKKPFTEIIPLPLKPKGKRRNQRPKEEIRVTNKMQSLVDKGILGPATAGQILTYWFGREIKMNWPGKEFDYTKHATERLALYLKIVKQFHKKDKLYDDITDWFNYHINATKRQIKHYKS